MGSLNWAGGSTRSTLEVSAKAGTEAGLLGLSNNMAGATLNDPAHGVVELHEAIVVTAEHGLGVRDTALSG